MTAAIIPGPWGQSPAVLERLIVERVRALLPRFEGLTDDELRDELDRAGIDAAMRVTLAQVMARRIAQGAA